jgi:TRAP-type uncharacterized transport system fused permease subunit
MQLKHFARNSIVVLASALAGCILGITLLAAALSRYFLVEMKRWEQYLCFNAAILLIAPGLSRA